MHPYREVHTPSAEARSRPPEELVGYGLLLAIGVIPVLCAALGRGPFGSEATVGLMMVSLGAVGLVPRSARP